MSLNYLKPQLNSSTTELTVKPAHLTVKLILLSEHYQFIHRITYNPT